MQSDLAPRAVTRRAFVSALALGAGALAIERFSATIIPRLPDTAHGPAPRRATSPLLTRTAAGAELRPRPDLEDGPVFRLNETGLFVWERIDGTNTVAGIAEDVARAYDIAPDRALRDTAALLNSLRQTGLTFGFTT